MAGNSVVRGGAGLIAPILANPHGSVESGGGAVGVGGAGIGASSADLFRILEQASDTASIRIEPVPAGDRPKGNDSPSSLANAGLPVGIADPATIVAASTRGTKAGIKSPPSSKKAAAVPDGATPKKRRGWKKPEGRPSRPLSAYNLFFQAEREAMVTRKNDEKGEGGLGGIKIKQEDGESRDSGIESGDCGTQARPTKRRRRGPPTGIGFATMAQTIAAKWKGLDGTSKTPFEKKAAVDRERYEKEMAVWKETDDFKKYEAERKRNARNRAKSGLLNAANAGTERSSAQEPKAVPMPTPLPLPPGAVGDDGLTPLQRMFEEGNGSAQASGAAAVVSPEMLAAQAQGQHGNLSRLAQQYLGPLQHLQAAHLQGKQAPETDGLMSPLPNNAEALQQQQLQLQMGSGAVPPFYQNFDQQQLQLHQQQHQPVPHHPMSENFGKEQALLAQQQRQLQLIQQQELQVQGLGFSHSCVPSSMQAQQQPSQQDPLLQQLLQQQQQGQASGHHPGAPAHRDEELLLQQLRRDSLAAGTATSSAPSSGAGNAISQRASLGLGTLFAPTGKRDSLGLGGASGKRDSLGLGSIFEMTTGTGQRGSLGMGSLFPPSGATVGQRGSLGLGGKQPSSTLPSSITQQVPQAQEHALAQQQQSLGQGDGRMSLQQMLQLQKLKRQQQDEAALAAITGTQEQQQHETDQVTTEPMPAPGGPSSLFDFQNLQQQQQPQQLQQQQHVGGDTVPCLGVAEAPQGATGAALLQQQQPGHQDDDLAMLANMFHQEGQQQQKQVGGGLEPTAV